MGTSLFAGETEADDDQANRERDRRRDHHPGVVEGEDVPREEDQAERGQIELQRALRQG